MSINDDNKKQEVNGNELTAPKLVKAIYNFKGDNNDELCFLAGEIIILTQMPSGGWWEGTLNGITGWFPSNYVEKILSNEENLLKTKSINSAINADEMINNRNIVISELIDSENGYIKEINETLNKYLLPLQQRKIFTENEINPIVNSFQMILHLHKSLHDLLNELMQLPLSEQRIGAVFMHLAPNMKQIHIEYCSLHPKFIYLIEKHKDELTQFLRTLSSSSTPATAANSSINATVLLTSCLSYSFRYLEKYPGTLQELQRYTDESHSDRGDIQRAGFLYREIDTLCLQKRRQKEMELEVMHGNVKNWPEDESSITTLGTAINMGSVTLISSPETGTDVRKDRYLVLFPSNLLLLSVSTELNSFVYEKNFPLSSITLPRLHREQTHHHNNNHNQSTEERKTFEILVTLSEFTDGTGKYIFQCTNSDEVKHWIQLMSQCKQSNESQITQKSLRCPSSLSSSSSSTSAAIVKEYNSNRKIRELLSNSSSIQMTNNSSPSSSSLSNATAILAAINSSESTQRTKYWKNRSLLPHSLERNFLNSDQNELNKKDTELTHNEEMSILKIIEAYCNDGNVKKQQQQQQKYSQPSQRSLKSSFSSLSSPLSNVSAVDTSNDSDEKIRKLKRGQIKNNENSINDCNNSDEKKKFNNEINENIINNENKDENDNDEEEQRVLEDGDDIFNNDDFSQKNLCENVKHLKTEVKQIKKEIAFINASLKAEAKARRRLKTTLEKYIDSLS